MGYYVNAVEGKEKWLENHGTEIIGQPLTLPSDPTKAIVCVVDNGRFTAAGIVYCKSELKAITLPDDARPKRFFEVPKIDLIEAGFITASNFGD